MLNVLVIEMAKFQRLKTNVKHTCASCVGNVLMKKTRWENIQDKNVNFSILRGFLIAFKNNNNPFRYCHDAINVGLFD